MNSIEETFVKAFIARDQRDRWGKFLLSEKNRGKALYYLAHTLDKVLDQRFVYDKRNPPPQIALQVETLLTEWRKTDPAQLCYVIAYSSDYDKTMMKLSEVNPSLQLENGAVVIVIPDRLAYYYAENYSTRSPQYILFRSQGITEPEMSS